MGWSEVIPAIAASATLLLVPGMLVGLFLGLRGGWLFALAPAISMTMLAVSSVVLPFVGVPWTPLWALTGALWFGIIVLILFRIVFRTRFSLPSATESQGSYGWPTVFSTVLIAVPLVLVVVFGVGSPGAFSQTYDNIFHLNLVTQTIETGNASPLVASRLSVPDATIAFYPNLWHALVALSSQISGTTVPVAINGFNLAAVALVWPSAILLLTRQLCGTTRTVALTTGVIAGGLAAVPVYLLFYGVLYPFFLGALLIPVVLAVVLQLLNLAQEPRIGSSLALALLLVGLMPSISLAHPGAMMGALALSVPVVIIAVFNGFRSLEVRQKAWRLVGFGAYLVAGFTLLVVVRPAFVRSPPDSMLDAAFQTVTLSLHGYGFPILIAAFALIGVFVALKYRRVPDVVAFGMWVVGALAFFVAAGVPFWRVRMFTVGVWYADAPRLAAIYAIAAIPLAVIGAVQVAKWVLSAAKPKRAAAVLAIGGVCSLLVVQLTAGWTAFVPMMRVSYTVDNESQLLSADEELVLEQLPDLVPENAVIAGNPWTGTALAYALSGREVLMPHVQTKLNADGVLVMSELRWADSRPEVCEAIRAEGVTYVLDFGDLEVHNGEHEFPGIEDLSGSGAVELVLSEGDAKLYEVTACD